MASISDPSAARTRADGTAHGFTAVAGLVLLGAGVFALTAPAVAGETPGSQACRTESRPAAVAFCTAGTPWLTPLAGCCGGHGAGITAPAGRFESALQVEFDPETGTWGLASLRTPSLPRFAELAAVSRSTEGLVEEILPGGAVMLDLRGRFQTLSMASRTARGALHLGCAESPLGLFEWLRHDAPVRDTTGWPEK